MKAGHGKVVRVHYRLTGDDGTLLDSSDGQEPLTYLHGYDGLLPGLEQGLEGLEAGQHARVDLLAADAYGPHDPDAIIHATRDQFPDGLVLTPGLEVSARSEEGTMTFRVVEVSETGAVLDGNHPERLARCDDPVCAGKDAVISDVNGTYYGGGSSAVVIGTTSQSIPAWSKISRANSAQVHSPTAATCQRPCGSFSTSRVASARWPT